MQLATAMNLRKAMDEETKRERFASWYSTLPGIPAHEKEIIERSLKYNVWKELIKLFVVYMILSLVWFFGAGQYDPFESVTGYSLIGKKSVIGVVQEDGESLRLKKPNKGEHVSYTLAELGMDPIKYSYGSRFQTYWEKEKNGEYQWGHNILMAMPQSDFRRVLLMIINSGFDSEELLGILSRRKNWMHQGKIAALKEKDSTADLLWTNMCMHSPLMCFWKDKNRRFAGASRRFLKYYGLSSVDELVGKPMKICTGMLRMARFMRMRWRCSRRGNRLSEPGGPVLFRGNFIIFWPARRPYTKMERLSAFWDSLWIWTSSLKMRNSMPGINWKIR